MGKREVERKGGTMYSGRACLKCEESYKLSPRIFADESLFLAPTVYEYESGRESILAEGTLCFGAHRV